MKGVFTLVLGDGCGHFVKIQLRLLYVCYRLRKSETRGFNQENVNWRKFCRDARNRNRKGETG